MNPRPPAPSAASVSLSRLLAESGYFDSEGNLHLAFVRREQIQPLANDLGAAHLTMTQLRRFFQHCRAIEARLKSGEPWERLAPQFVLIDAAAERSFRRRPPVIPKLFYDFLRDNVAAVRTRKDFLEGFLPHFEALLGFATGSLQKITSPTSHEKNHQPPPHRPHPLSQRPPRRRG